ncbi:MAG: 3-hydroxyacyl-CoA dehydrogenase NAD-binding domain-containing protein [Marinifilaceae bacterium]|jgi:3-hydroxyacyl-CoA dehydrogenase/enoyl-CoA hydratase/3-hydroxybutyryl-CoA epimerase|nr:3-hydroxyacyl-CoA dehydrogenase NAD-binding domain-containing protein [Marinifilaceae bacterium]
MERSFKLNMVKPGVCHLEFDLVGEKLNKLSTKVFNEFEEILEKLESDKEIEYLVFRSAKKDNFIAGADINEIREIETEQQAEQLCNMGNEIFTRFSKLPFKTIALIDGSCMGGGLEFALCFDYRICTDHISVKIGLPELNLGIYPGLGGTQRLPKLIGLQKAVELIIGAKILGGIKAMKYGIIDKCCHREYLDRNLDDFISSLKKGWRRKKRKTNFLESTWIGRKIFFSAVKKKIIKNTKGHYPAPLVCLKLIIQTYRKSVSKGLKLETRYFKPLAISSVSKNLINIFFTSEKLKKDRGVDTATDIQINNIDKAAVIGAGVMGAGICWLFNKNKIDVILKDLNFNMIAKALGTCKSYYNYFLRTRKMTRQEVDMRMVNIITQTDYNGFKSTDIVIEAIFEDLEAKQNLISEIEANSSDTTIIASNTSSLSINDLASSMQIPSRFIGLHFFNTPNRMQLVEVIVGDKTSERCILDTVNLIKKLKRIPIVVKDSPGFIVNRVLMPFMVEAFYLLENGIDMSRIDRLMKEFGMPMGPFELADFVGLDILSNVSKIFESKLGSSAKSPQIVDIISSDKDCLGRKTGKGFYVYSKTKANRVFNDSMKSAVEKYRKEKNIKTLQLSDSQIKEMLIYRMINEAYKCMEEGIVADENYIDIAMIYGAGFPPFRGGVFRYAKSIGESIVYKQLKDFENIYGERFTPSKWFEELKQSDLSKTAMGSV